MDIYTDTQSHVYVSTLSSRVCAYKQTKRKPILKDTKLLITSDLSNRSDGEGRRERERKL